MKTINKQIDRSIPTDRRLQSDVEKYPEVEEIVYPLPKSITGQKWYTIEQVFSQVEEILNNHYGTDLKLKY